VTVRATEVRHDGHVGFRHVGFRDIGFRDIGFRDIGWSR
jgi:hypothetical protein